MDRPVLQSSEEVLLCRAQSASKQGRHAEYETHLVMFCLTLAQLAQHLNATLQGPADLEISGICSLERPQPGQLGMAETAANVETLQKAGVAAILHGESLTIEGPSLVVTEPRVAFAKLLDLFRPEIIPAAGIHPTAVVDPRAKISESAVVGPHCSIGPNVEVGPEAYLQAFVSLAENVVVGARCRLYAHVMIGQQSQLGEDCRLEPWAQVGNGCRLGQGVDLGAHSSLARDVVVEPGVKIDNLVVVGARSVIGAASLLVGQSSVDRDAKLHPGVILAGQSAVGPEAELVSGVQLGGRSWALGKLDKPGPYLGNPARPLKEEMRRQALEKRKQASSSAATTPTEPTKAP